MIRPYSLFFNNKSHKKTNQQFSWNILKSPKLVLLSKLSVSMLTQCFHRGNILRGENHKSGNIDSFTRFRLWFSVRFKTTSLTQLLRVQSVLWQTSTFSSWKWSVKLLDTTCVIHSTISSGFKKVCDSSTTRNVIVKHERCNCNIQ